MELASVQRRVAADPAARPWPEPRFSRAALVTLCLAGGALVVVLGSRLAFFNDDWYFLLQRPGLESGGGLDALLAPHNGGMVVPMALTFKFLVAAFGLHSQIPFRVPLGAMTAALGVVVYLLVRERVGTVLALTAAAVMVFLGPAWEALLFISGANHLTAVTLGLWVLFALERDRRRADVVACLLLVGAISISNTGVAMLVGAAIAVGARRHPRDLWIVAMPAAVYALWWLFYGHRQSTGITAGHLEHLPGYVFDSASAGLASVTGTLHGGLPSLLHTGHALTVVAVAGLVARVWLGGWPGPFAWAFAGALAAFWLLTGASAIPGRGAISSRYQITDAALLIVLAAELARGVRLPPWALWALAGGGAAVVASNLLVLKHGYDFLRVEAGYADTDLGALQLAGARAPANLWLLAAVAQDPYLSGVTAGRYFAVTRDHGRPPVYDPGQLARAPAALASAADSVLIAAYRFVALPLPAGSVTGDCRRLRFHGLGQLGAVPASGEIEVANVGSTVTALGLTRFGPARRPHYIAFLAAHHRYRLTVPRDRSPVAWRVSLLALPPASLATATICPS